MHLKSKFKSSLVNASRQMDFILSKDLSENGFNESQFLSLIVSLWKIRVVMWMKNINGLTKK